MLSNITIGQYYPANSPIHRLDPRVKILLTIVFITSVFLVKTIAGYGIVLLFVLLCTKVSTVPVKMMARGIKPLRFILILTFLINLFFSQSENVWFKVWFITVTWDGIALAVRFCLRIIFLVLGTSLLTLTTSPVALSDGLELLLKPLKVIRFPAHELAMMMTIALRFIPTLLEEADKIMKAQMARGADFESGNLIKRAKAMIPLLVPLFVSAFRRALDLAMAMEARCYHGGDNRTRLRVLKVTKTDYAASGVTLFYLALIILERTFL